MYMLDTCIIMLMVFCDDLPIVSHQPRLKCYRPSVKIKNIRGWLCKTNLPDCDIFFIPGSAPGCDDLTMTCDAEFEFEWRCCRALDYIISECRHLDNYLWYRHWHALTLTVTCTVYFIIDVSYVHAWYMYNYVDGVLWRFTYSLAPAIKMLST